MSQILRNKINSSFPKPFIFIGVLFILFSVFIILQHPFTAFILFTIGLFLSTTSFGSEISMNQGLYRSYTNFFGIKVGKWNQLSSMSGLVILLSQNGYTAYSRSNRSINLIEKKYDVCLVNNSHRNKFVIQKFKTQNEAELYATFLSKLLKIDLMEFNPTISEKTRARRSRNTN